MENTQKHNSVMFVQYKKLHEWPFGQVKGINQNIHDIVMNILVCGKL